MIRTIILVGLGGGLGSIFRYLISVGLTRYFPGIFPLGTFAVNVLGCLVAGVVLGLLERQQITNPDLRFLLVVGFCGGFTSFSAFASENITLLLSGYSWTTFLYIALSVIICLLAVWVGRWVSDFL